VPRFGFDLAIVSYVGQGPKRDKPSKELTAGVSFAVPIDGGHDGEVGGERYFLCSDGTGYVISPHPTHSAPRTYRILIAFFICFLFLCFFAYHMYVLSPIVSNGECQCGPGVGEAMLRGWR
jgi:hypothetical protein